jgi:PEGA domain
MRWCTVLLLVASIASTNALARAEDAPDPRKRAAAWSEQGLKRFEAGKWSEADEAFREAEALFHAPTLVLYRAHCQKRLGKTAAALALYRSVAGEQLPADAPTPFLTAQAVAREEIEGLRRHVAVVRVTAAGELPAGAAITVDGVAVGAAPQAIEVDPGDHVVEATAPGAAPFRSSVSLKEGAAADVAIALPVIPAPPASAADPPPAPLPAPRTGSIIPALAAFSVGVVGAGVGTVTGVASLQQASAIRARCSPGGLCASEDQPKAASAGRLADASTAAFVIAGAASAAGVALLIVRPRLGEPSGASAAVDVGPGWLGVRGTL